MLKDLLKSFIPLHNEEYDWGDRDADSIVHGETVATTTVFDTDTI